MYIGINAQNIYIGIKTQYLKKWAMSVPVYNGVESVCRKWKSFHWSVNTRLQIVANRIWGGCKVFKLITRWKDLTKLLLTIEALNFSFLKSGIHLIESLRGIQTRNAIGFYIVSSKCFVVKIVIKLKFRRNPDTECNVLCCQNRQNRHQIKV